MKPLSLRKNFLWVLVGNLIYAATQWGILVVLAKQGTPTMVGQFTLALAVTAPIILLSNLQLRSVQSTDAQNDYSFSEYLGLRLLTSGLAFLVILLLVFVSDYQLETRLTILAIGLSKCFEALSDIYLGLLQRHERMDRIGQSLIIEGIITLLAFSAMIVFTHSILLATMALALIWGLHLVFYDMRSGHRLLARLQDNSRKPSFKRETLLRLAWLALPLGISTAVSSFTTNLPRYYVANLFGESELGIFGASVYLLTIGSVIINALGQAATPRLGVYFVAENRKAFLALLLKLVTLGFGLSVVAFVGVVFAGEWVLTLLYSPEYAKSADVLVLLVLAGGFHYTFVFFGSALNALRRFGLKTVIYGPTVLVTWLLCISLIPSYGIYGAGLAILGKSIFEAVALVIGFLYAFPKFTESSLMPKAIIN